jgi:hypothetical protein
MQACRFAVFMKSEGDLKNFGADWARRDVVLQIARSMLSPSPASDHFDDFAFAETSDGSHAFSPFSNAASLRLARNRMSLMLAVFTPNVCAISSCDDPSA